MGLLALKPKPQPKEEKPAHEPRTKTKKLRRGMSAVNIVLLVLGAVGAAVFGFLFYESYIQGGLNTVTGMADSVGLIISLIILFFGIYAK